MSASFQASFQNSKRRDLKSMLAAIDQMLGQQLDAILHHPSFQTLESAWRGPKFLVDRTDFRSNVIIETLDISKESLRRDFEDAPELPQSGPYQHTYIQEYDTADGYRDDDYFFLKSRAAFPGITR